MKEKTKKKTAKKKTNSVQVCNCQNLMVKTSFQVKRKNETSNCVDSFFKCFLLFVFSSLHTWHLGSHSLQVMGIFSRNFLPPKRLPSILAHMCWNPMQLLTGHITVGFFPDENENSAGD